MKTISIPGWGSVEIKNVVLDLNGTVTESGDVIPGVLDGLQALQSEGLRIFVLSGDTRSTLKKSFDGSLGIEPVITKTAAEKSAFVESIGPAHTVCIGNGNIDVDMFRVSKISICTIQAEGAAGKAVFEADIIVTHIRHAIEILLDSAKLIATLRA